MTRSGLSGWLLGICLALAPWMASAQSGNRPFNDGFDDGIAPANDAAAARFLDQATFGGRVSDIQHLRDLGYDAWLTEQFAAAVSLEKPFLTGHGRRLSVAAVGGVVHPHRAADGPEQPLAHP